MGFVPFTFIGLIDILFVAYIMYWIYRTTKGTNAPTSFRASSSFNCCG